MSFRVVAAFVIAWMLGVGDVQAADACPNSAFRTGPSAALPDCRAYELVSPDLNHANASVKPGLASADGNTMVYGAGDAPEHASSAQALSNYVRARRDPVRGWSGVSLSPPLLASVTGYGTFRTLAFSTDLSSTLETGDQPLSGGSLLAGQSIYVGRRDGTYRLVTTTPSAAIPLFVGGTPDFNYVFFQPAVKQLPLDPLAANNTYEWSQEHGLRLIGILEDGTPAPAGASFAGASDDGRYVAFTADNKLYLRIDGKETVEVGASQRTVDPDPNPAQTPRIVAVAADGSKVLFTSSSELTNDANTGRSGGVATDAGRDLYSYDVATGKLTDLTVDTNPSDVAAGANIQSDGSPGSVPIVRASADGSIVYFMATGDLADGHTLGHTSLYVWHDGRIEFVADADGMLTNFSLPSWSITPDGRHVMFVSVDRLTGYDNTDPVTGQPHNEVFAATIGEGVECASCRSDGSRPTGDSTLPPYAKGRMMSDNGRRVFFHSTDALVPQAPGGQTQVYEYADGKVSAISRPDGPPADFRDTSASGDDVFFETYDDQLVPNPNAGDSMIYDARVDGGFPIAIDQDCSGIACQPSAPPAPMLAITGSVTFLGEGNVVEEPARSTRGSKVAVSKIKTITGAAGLLKVKVPGKGRLTVSGPSLRTRRSSPAKAQTVTVRLGLTTMATKSLRKRRSVKTKVRVAFSDSAGRTSAVTLSVTFKVAGTTRKGR